MSNRYQPVPSEGYHKTFLFPLRSVHMKPLNPRNPPFPFTLSEAPSSVVFFSLGLSLMFCAPPVVREVSKRHRLTSMSAAAMATYLVHSTSPHCSA
jgi:hypothetical protein